MNDLSRIGAELMFSLLYVDDEPDLLEIAKVFLERKGEFIVRTCTSAIEALSLMQETTFDMIISDYQMPHMDGITFLKKTRENFGTLPFILFTGRGREEVVIDAINNGADFYLQKGGDPVSQFAELAHQVRQAIRHRRDERIIRTNEERLRKAQTIGKTGSWEYNVETDRIWASEEGFRIFGYHHLKSGDIEIEQIESCIPERDRVHQALIDLIVDGTAYNLEYEIKPADGEPSRTVTSIASLDRNPKGDPVKIVGVVQDITERKQMERALQQSEERFRSIFEKGPLGMALVDKSFHFTGANPAFCTLLGYTEEQLQSMTIAEVTHPDDVAQDLESVKRLNTGALAVYAREKRYIRRDGGIMWGAVTVQAIRDSTGAFLYNLALIEDITDRKRADDELRAAYEQITADEEELRSQLDEIHESQDALKRSEQRYRAVINNAPLGMQFYTLQPDQRLLLASANPAADSILGADHSTLINRSIEEIFPALAGTDISEQFCRVALDGGVWQTELEIPWTNGGPRSYGVWTFQISVGNMVAVYQDITESRRAEQSIRKEQEKLQSITDTVPGAVYQYAISEDGDQRFLFISKGVEELLGISQETALTDFQRVWNLIVPEDRPALDESIRQAAGTRQPWEQVFRIRRDDGSVRWIQAHSSHSRETSRFQHIWDGTFTDITAHKQADRALVASERRYRDIVEASPDMVWEIDTRGRFIYISPQSIQSMGYSPDELIGRPLFSLIPTDALPLVQTTLDHHLNNSQRDLITLEVPAHHRDGRLLTIEIRSSPVRNDQGETVGFRGIARDITERKYAEERIKRFQIFAENAHDIILFIRKSDGRIVEANRAATRAYGYSLDELLGMTIYDLRPSSNPILIQSQMDMATSEGILFETVHKRKDQSLVPMEVNSFAAFFDGEPVLLSICRDITKRKRAEDEAKTALEQVTVIEEELRQNFEELSASQQHLQESEQKFRSLAEDSQDCIMRYDRQYRHLYMNPAGLRITGLREGQVIGRTLCEIGFDKSLALKWEGKIQQVFDTGRSVQMPLSWKTAEGLIVQDMKLTPEFDEQGPVKSVLGVARDITELKQVEDSLRQGNRQLNLLSSITRHDIMNKIMVMQGYLDFAKDENLDKAGVATLIQNMEEVTTVIQSQIGFTRIYQDLGVHEPIWQRLTEILPTCSVPDTIQFLVDLDDIEVYADPMLEKVFYNLLDNSIRHGQSVTRISVSSIESADKLVIIWEDDGIGVPLGEKELIFRRGYGKNTGFGAFLIREILAITSCTITETGIPGSGARFEIVVPSGAYRRS